MGFRRHFCRFLHKICDYLTNKWFLMILYAKSLCYNSHLEVGYGYCVDTLLEPMFWFVDNFTHMLGPIFVISVISLLVVFVVIAYIIGLTYWWQTSKTVTFIAVPIGHWILINVIYHYFMALTVSPGHPPENQTIAEVVSFCKKCISPKPSRTHHCSVCNRCVLKMDHHCPWLNNCIGHFNHRYFFMFCVYTWIGTVFVMIFGHRIAFDHFWPKTDINSMTVPNNSTLITTDFYSYMKHKCIIFEGLTAIGLFVALGALIAYHSLLITKGETCIERHINKKEAKRLAEFGKKYRNPYDFGPQKNWKRFLGLNRTGNSWLNVLLPSSFPPSGDGINWLSKDQNNYKN